MGKLTLLLQHDPLLQRISVHTVHFRVFTEMVSSLSQPEKKPEPLSREGDRLSTLDEFTSSAGMATAVIC